MRPWAPSLGLMLAVAAAALAAAQDKPRPRVTVVVKAPTAASATPSTARAPSPAPGQPVLRKPLGLAAAAQAPLSLSVAALVIAKSDSKGGLASMKGLNPPSGSAQAAQCRASCAQARYVCTARDAGDCDTPWGECVVRCSGANYTRTPDLAAGPSAPAWR